MSNGVQYSCSIWEKLVNNPTKKRSSTEFLPFPGAWPGFAEGDLWAQGWHFAVSRFMADALDIVYTTFSRKEIALDKDNKPIPLLDEQGVPVRKNGKLQYKKNTFYEAKWTQGSTFRMRQGMMFYDTPIPDDETWSKSLPHINRALRILEAKPVEPAKGDVPRKPGLVRYQSYFPNPERTRMEPAQVSETTQDGFIYLLITGKVLSLVEKI